MKKIIHKMNLSIITCALILILNVTTTFAWAGLQNYSNVENFDVSLESSQTYQIMVSLDGVNFSNEINEVDFKRAILENMKVISKLTEIDEEDINKRFEEIVLEPLTTKRIGNELGTFVSIDEIRKDNFNYDSIVESDLVKKSYFNFDIYVSIDYIGEDSDQKYLNNFQEIYIKDMSNLLTGDNKTYKLNSNHVLENYLLDQVLSTVKVNSSSATRISFTKYKTLERGQVEDETPLETIIYQGGTSKPTYDNGIYSFGGFLNAGDNLAYLDFNDIHENNPINIKVFDEFYSNRVGEFGFEDAISIDQLETNNYKLITVEDGLNTNTMIKINVKMWLEGFDADCFEVISAMPVGFNLKLVHYSLH